MELLGVIVILAIIILIAVSGYGKISKNVKEKSHENLVSYIETKASDYANDTGNLLTNVDNLVKLGYIDADDEEGNVKSPIDGSRLNCHIVSIRKEENSLYGEYSEEEECNLDNLVIKNQNLGINIYATSDNVTKGEKIEENTWTNKNVILEAYIGEKINIEDVKKITWQSNIGQETRDISGDFFSKNEYLVTAEQIVNTEYSAIIELNDGTSYQTQVKVKIDKQRPIIYEVFVEKKEEWTNQNKKITVTASDGNGSGIYGYYIGTNSNCNEIEYDSNNNESYVTSKDSGTYYVCIKDNAGNVSEDISTKKFEIKFIDKTPPKCIYGGEAPKVEGMPQWTKDNRTVTINCSDDESGCVLQDAISVTYSSNTKTVTLDYTIEDKAGNQIVCDKTLDIYVDKCTEYGEKIYGSWSSCSKSCGGGKKSRTWEKKSTFGSEFVCEEGKDSKSCNTKSCHSSDGGDSGGGGGVPCKNPHTCWVNSGGPDEHLATCCG